MLEQKAIYCIECGTLIQSRRDLVIAWHFLSIRPFHKACYNKSLKGLQTVFVHNYPINGIVGNVRVVLSCLIVCFLVAFSISRPPLYSISVGELIWEISALMLFIFVWAILPRLLSWLWYERRLPP